MRKKLSLGIMLILTVLYFQSYAQPVLLPNGSFENGFENYAPNFSYQINNAFKDGKV
jgi:hypothetical protein